MISELYRLNKVYEYEINYPIQLYREKHFKHINDIIFMNAFNDKIFISADTFLACLCFESGEVLWERRSDSFIDKPVLVEEERVFSTVDDVPASLDLRTGNIWWKADHQKELTIGASKEFLYGKQREGENYKICCRSKRTGNLNWSFNRIFDAPTEIASENGIVIIKTMKGIHALVEGGNLLWEFTMEDFLKKHNLEQASPQYSFPGPLIDGIYYLSLDPDYLIALNAANGDLIWHYRSDTPVQPSTMIHYKGKIYFDLAQSWGTNNSLFCVDAKTGEEILKTKENFTPQGCVGPLITGKYLIGGNKQFLAFFDLEKQEFVWRFKERKNRPIFGGAMYPYKDQLIVCKEKTLFWFKIKKK